MPLAELRRERTLVGEDEEEFATGELLCDGIVISVLLLVMDVGDDPAAAGAAGGDEAAGELRRALRV